VTTDITPLDDRRPIWDTGISICFSCRHRWVDVFDVRADASSLECPRCRKMTGVVVISRATLIELIDQ